MTHQRMVNKIFKQLIERNIEVYADNMIVKSKMTDLHLTDLAEIFQVLKRFNICLDTSKYAFRVHSEKFLRFIVH